MVYLLVVANQNEYNRARNETHEKEEMEDAECEYLRIEFLREQDILSLNNFE